MGRKSKIKKERKEISLQPKSELPPEKKLKSTEFVREIQKFGYQISKLERSPQLPEHKREPEV
jgi:hypothetical protein